MENLKRAILAREIAGGPRLLDVGATAAIRELLLEHDWPGDNAGQQISRLDLRAHGDWDCVYYGRREPPIM